MLSSDVTNSGPQRTRRCRRPSDERSPNRTTGRHLPGSLDISGPGGRGFHRHTPLGTKLGAQCAPSQRSGGDQGAQKNLQIRPFDQGQTTELHPGGITTFGAMGPQTTPFVDDAANFYSAKCAVERGVCRRQLVERLQVALLQGVGKRLLAAINSSRR